MSPPESRDPPASESSTAPPPLRITPPSSLLPESGRRWPPSPQITVVDGLLPPNRRRRRIPEPSRRDSFTDAGNYPLSDLAESTRALYYPYGSSDNDHGSPTGRFSNGLVQSDFLARILGLQESPPAERQREQDGVDPSGMNFVVGSVGVCEGTNDAHSLDAQVDKFRRLVKHGIIGKDLTDAV